MTDELSKTGGDTTKDRAALLIEEGTRPKSDSFFVEYIDFLKNNKKWWLLPILLALLLFGVLVIVAGSGAAPFIYTIF